MANAKHVAAVLGLVPFMIGLGAAAPAFAEGTGSARGSISIENQELTDAETSNEVKVGCDFRIDFFGFDTATVPVSFTAMQPSGNGEVLEQRTVTLEDADPDGGNDFSGSLYVDLTADLKNIEPAVAQDYDYKVRVEATVKQTAGAEITKKSMLFIVCDPEGEVTPAPVVTEPVVPAPVVTEPVVPAPVVTEPVVTEPVVTEPVVTEPVVTEPVVTEPGVAEPVVTPAPAPAPAPGIVTPSVETLPEVEEAAARGENVSALAETGASPWLAVVAAALLVAAGLVLRRFSVRASV